MQSDEQKPLSASRFYPPVSAHETGRLDVGDGHEIYWEVSGKPDGKPALFLHGGPGGSTYADHRRFFDPEVYRIVLFDQRGAGRSTPKGALHANTTAHLVEDIEKLRRHLGVENWLVLGGSWGAALALAYGEAHPTRVRAFVLRGVFTARQCEVDWLYKFGASAMFPEEWRKFVDPIPVDERGDLVAAYHRRLTDRNPDIRRTAARTWVGWESALLTMKPRPARYVAPGEGDMALARIEAHYFVNGSFMREGEILANVGRLAHIPGHIVQGRYDVITPPRTAHELAANWPAAKLHIVDDAGHASSEPGILAKLVEGTNLFRTL